VLAARSKLWRGQLCSEHFARSGAGTDAAAAATAAKARAETALAA